MTSSSGVEALVSELLSDVTFGGVVYAVAAASGSRVAAAALYHAASCIGLAVSATFGATLDAPMLAVLYASVLIPLGADAWAILMAACAGSSCCSDGMSAPSFGFGVAVCEQQPSQVASAATLATFALSAVSGLYRLTLVHGYAGPTNRGNVVAIVCINAAQVAWIAHDAGGWLAWGFAALSIASALVTAWAATGIGSTTFPVDNASLSHLVACIEAGALSLAVVWLTESPRPEFLSRDSVSPYLLVGLRAAAVWPALVVAAGVGAGGNGDVKVWDFVSVAVAARILQLGASAAAAFGDDFSTPERVSMAAYALVGSAFTLRVAQGANENFSRVGAVASAAVDVAATVAASHFAVRRWRPSPLDLGSAVAFVVGAGLHAATAIYAAVRMFSPPRGPHDMSFKTTVSFKSRAVRL